MKTRFWNASSKINTFFNSKKCIFLFFGLGLIITALELFLFFFGGMEINGYDSENNMLLPMMAVVFSILSLYIGIWADVENTRGSKKATWVAFFSIVFAAVVNLLAGLILCFVYSIISCLLLVVRKISWEREWYRQERFSYAKIGNLIGVINILIVVSFFGIVVLFGNELYGNTPLDSKKFEWFQDAFVASVSLMGAVALVFRWKMGYVWWGVSNIPLIFFFLFTGNLIPSFHHILTLFIDMTVVMALSHQERDYVHMEYPLNPQIDEPERYNEDSSPKISKKTSTKLPSHEHETFDEFLDKNNFDDG